MFLFEVEVKCILFWAINKGVGISYGGITFIEGMTSYA